MKPWIRHLLTGLLCLALPITASAENSTREAGYAIHHNAIPSAMLSPEIASRYGLVRSKYRGLLNVSVIREIPGTHGEAVAARVEASARNLAGRVMKIPMREVREGDAIYYLGEFPIVNGETLDFSLKVQPAGARKAIETGLQQQFFID